jgi:hypothetical protein
MDTDKLNQMWPQLYFNLYLQLGLRVGNNVFG